MNTSRKYSTWSCMLLILTLISCQKTEIPILTPVFSSSDLISMTDSTAAISSTILSDSGDSIIVRGVCWNTTGSPTVSDSVTRDSLGTAHFSSSLRKLKSATTYYFRAYATNKNGTGFSAQTKFTTAPVKGYTVSDIDGNVYNTVTIGKQVWLVENLKTKKYNNGDSIGTTYPATKSISSETNPKYQWAYNGDEAGVATSGRLYTWFAANDPRGIAPAGWHVATDDEWKELLKYVTAHSGTSVSVAKALASTLNWTISTTTNSIGSSRTTNNYSGFSALPGGMRNYNTGTFTNMGLIGAWWTSTYLQSSGASGYSLYYNQSTATGNSSDRMLGLSVRCVRD